MAIMVVVVVVVVAAVGGRFAVFGVFPGRKTRNYESIIVRFFTRVRPITRSPSIQFVSLRMAPEAKYPILDKATEAPWDFLFVEPGFLLPQ